MNFLKALINKLVKPKRYVLENKHQIEEAFTLHGARYYMFSEGLKAPAGRMMTALHIYEEMRMKCSREYLEKHCKAMEIILSDPKKINIQTIAVLNKNLRERLDMALLPDYIYRLASVMFFDKSESPYNYDVRYNQQKINRWKKEEGALDFFLKGPLLRLMPFLDSLPEDSKTFFRVADQVDQMHQKDLHEALSRLQ